MSSLVKKVRKYAPGFVGGAAEKIPGGVHGRVLDDKGKGPSKFADDLTPDEMAAKASATERRRRAQAQGRRSTILSDPLSGGGGANVGARLLSGTR